MKNQLIAGLVATLFFCSLPVAAQEKEKEARSEERVVTVFIQAKQNAPSTENRFEETNEVQRTLERGRSRLEQKGSKIEKVDKLGRSLLIQKF